MKIKVRSFWNSKPVLLPAVFLTGILIFALCFQVVAQKYSTALQEKGPADLTAMEYQLLLFEKKADDLLSQSTLLLSEINELRKEKQTLQSALKERDRIITQLEDELDGLSDIEGKTKNQIADYQQIIRALEIDLKTAKKENDFLTKELKSAQGQAQSLVASKDALIESEQNAAHQLQSELKNLKDQKAQKDRQLQDANARAKASESQQEKLQDKVSKLSKKITSLESELTSLKTTKTEGNRTLKEELSDKDKELRQADQQKRELERAMDDLERQLADLSSETESFKKSKQQLESEGKKSEVQLRQDYEARIKELKEELNKSKSNFENSEEERGSYRKQIKMLISENENLKKALDQRTGHLDSQLGLADKQLEEKNRLIQDLKVEAQEAESLKRRLNKERTAKINTLTQLGEKLEGAFSDEISNLKMKLTLAKEKVVVTLKTDVLFDSGSDELRISSVPLLNKISGVLNDEARGYRIVIEGHTDNEPIQHSRWNSNWELSSARALSVLNYLTEQKGVSGNRCSVCGYGEYSPVTENKTESQKERNRRVEIILLP